MGLDQSANGSLRAVSLQTAKLKFRPETVHVLPFYLPTTWKAGFEFRTLGSLGCCSPRLPSLPDPAVSHDLGGSRCTYMGLPAHTSKLRPHTPSLGPAVLSTLGRQSQEEASAGTASWVPRAWHGSTQTWREAEVGLGRGPPRSGLRRALFTDTLRWLRNRLLQINALH